MKDIKREERRTISEGECPVDLMGELFKAKSENEFLMFTLTAKAFLAMCAFPVDKMVEFIKPIKGEQIIQVSWVEFEDFMVLRTYNQCNTFQVSFADTEEIKYDSNDILNEQIIHYIIDVG